jgi:hypothetical protein
MQVKTFICQHCDEQIEECQHHHEAVLIETKIMCVDCFYAEYPDQD